MVSVQNIKVGIRASSSLGHITNPALDALAKILFDATKPYQNRLLTPEILLDVQRKVANAIVKQSDKFVGLDDFAAPHETLERFAEDMKRKKPLSDLSDPSKYPVKDETLDLVNRGTLTCGKAVEIDPYVFMPNP